MIKKEQNFIENGFGNSASKTRYKKWDKDVIELHSQCSAELDKLDLGVKTQSELFDICVAATNLYNLGVHYAMNGCVEDSTTGKWNASIRKAFRINRR